MTTVVKNGSRTRPTPPGTTNVNTYGGRLGKSGYDPATGTFGIPFPPPTPPGAPGGYGGQGPAPFQQARFDPSGYKQARSDRETGYQAYLKKMREAEGLVSTGRGQSLADVAEYYDDLERGQEAAQMNTGFQTFGGGGSQDKRLAEMRRATSGYDQNLAGILAQQARTGMEHGAGMSGLAVRGTEAEQQYGLAQQKFGLESRGQDLGREATLGGLAQRGYETQMQAYLARLKLEEQKRQFDRKRSRYA